MKQVTLKKKRHSMGRFWVTDKWSWSGSWYIGVLGQEDPLEEGMATRSSILAWRIPWTEELGRLLSIGSQRVGHNWSYWVHEYTHTHTHTHTHIQVFIYNHFLNWQHVFHTVFYTDDYLSYLRTMKKV